MNKTWENLHTLHLFGLYSNQKVVYFHCHCCQRRTEIPLVLPSVVVVAVALKKVAALYKRHAKCLPMTKNGDASAAKYFCSFVFDGEKIENTVNYALRTA